MALSEYFSDDDIITQLRLQFEEDNMWDTDFHIFLNTAEEIGDDFYITVRGRDFVIDGVTGEVSDVTGELVEDLDEDEDNVEVVEVVELETNIDDDVTGDDDNNDDDNNNDNNDDTEEDDDNTEDETE